MDLLADVADAYAYGELRVSHEQNIILPHVAKDDLYALYSRLDAAGLGTANGGKITDMIACPGLDYCSLANARSIPLAQDISRRFEDAQLTDKIGDLSIKISGCINACGHHHVGHIGILGVDKQGVEFYQILLGGRADENASLGVITGKGLSAEAVPDAIERVVNLYLKLRKDENERFIDALERLGREAFAEALHEPA
jgi:sulfite reductase (NADPH) hemoprotein beta-component